MKKAAEAAFSLRYVDNRRLFVDDDFLCHRTFLARNDEEIHAVGVGFHVIIHAVRPDVVVSVEVVNQIAFHVINLNVDFASEVFEIQGHFAVVRVWHDVDVGEAFALFFNAVERADEPVFAFNALRSAFVEYFCRKPHCVGNIIQDINVDSETVIQLFDWPACRVAPLN